MLSKTKMVEARRKAIEELYDSRFDCITLVEEEDEDGISHSTEIKTIDNLSCHISYKTYLSTSTTTTTNVDSQVKLFTYPTIKIPEGSIIVVRHGPSGEVLRYKASSPPAIYSSHQEVLLELDKRYA